MLHMMRAMRALVLLTFLLPAACAGVRPPAPTPPPAVADESVQGVSYARYGDGKTSSYHVATIDLDAPRLTFLGSSEEDRGRTVGEFAREYDTLVAINGDYFDEWLAPVGPSRGYCGDWEVRAPPVKRRQPVFVAGPGRASIIEAGEEIPQWASAAVSGWPTLVTGCRAIPAAELPGSDHFTRANHVRTAVGLSRDGRTVYFVVADLVREGQYGVTLAELGRFMREELGACEVLNLDGGGSSALNVGGRTVSRPKSGVERHVANHLGVVLAGKAPGCDTTGATGTEWNEVSRRVGLQVASSDGRSARFRVPAMEGEVMLISSRDDVVATGTLVTSQSSAERLQRELTGDLRVSWTTPLDDGRVRVQLGGRGSLDSLERGLKILRGN